MDCFATLAMTVFEIRKNLASGGGNAQEREAEHWDSKPHLQAQAAPTLPKFLATKFWASER